MALPLSTNPSYHACTCCCEAAKEQSLEVIFKLSQCFDGHYPADLLVFVLRELNPPVLLQADTETGRRDWPWRSDQHLDAVAQDCCHYLGRPTPMHELLATLAPLSILELVHTQSGAEFRAQTQAQAVGWAWHQSLRLMGPGKYC